MTDEEHPGRRMTIDRRALLVGAGLAVCGGISYLRQPSKTSEAISSRAFKQLIPKKVGGWTASISSDLILPSADDLSAKLYENLETLIYEGPDLPGIMFLIAYSSVQQNDVQVHRPEVCYPMSGYPILNNRPIQAKVGELQVPSRFLIADRSNLNEMILYWTRVGRAFPLGWEQQRIEMAKSGLQGVVPDGALVRFSMISQSEKDAQNTLTDFAGMMRQAMSKEGLRVFFG